MNRTLHKASLICYFSVEAITLPQPSYLIQAIHHASSKTKQKSSGTA